jgi:hypothetical protein
LDFVGASGDVPVQRRMSRPVPLRPTLLAARDVALRTWATDSDAEQLRIARLNPAGAPGAHSGSIIF